jgi:hypothetical protein
MGKPIKVHLGQGYRIRDKGVFNLDKIYSEAHSKIIDLGYSDFDEVTHEHKKTDKGDEIVLSWLAEKKVTEFIKLRIVVDLVFNKIWPASDDLVSGNAEIIFKAFVIPDYKEKWSSSKLKQFLYDIYLDTLYKSQLFKYIGKVDEDIKEVHDIIKEVLEFYR